MSYTAKSKLKKLNSLTLSRVQFFVVPWTAACQAPLSTGAGVQPPQDPGEPEGKTASVIDLERDKERIL